MDRRDAVYIEQNTVQVLFQRHPQNLEPCMQIHLRCSIENLLLLQKLCLSLHKEMDNLCKEYPGLYIDSYFLCPHCLLIGSTTPTKRPTTDIVLDHKTSLELVPCDPHSPGKCSDTRSTHLSVASWYACLIIDYSHLTRMMWNLMSSGIGAAAISDVKEMTCMVSNVTVHTYRQKVI